MRNHKFLRLLLPAAAAAFAFLLPAQQASAASAASILNFLKDPQNVQSLTAPSPDARWMPDASLPVVPAPNRAQQPKPGELSRPLSLAEVTDLALQLNPRTRQAWLTARVEAANLGIERAGDFPTITGLFSHRIGRSVSATTGAPIPVQTVYGPSVSLSYILYDFGQSDASEEAAKYRLLAANLTQNRTLQEVATLVEQAYYRVLGFDQLALASRQSLTNFETALDATQRRRSSGLATAGDEFRAQTQVGQARLVVTRNEGELSKARGQLASAIGLPIDFPLQLEAVTALPPVSEITQSMDALLKKAKESRPDLIAAEARAQAARATARSVSKAGLPSIEFVANYGQTYFTNGAPASPNNANFSSSCPTCTDRGVLIQGDPYPPGVRRPEQDTYQFGFNVRIPIFSGFKDTYSVRRAQEVAEQAENARDQLYSQTELDVWQAYFDLQTSASSIASTANLVRSAGESAAAATARYRAGVGSLIDFITAELDNTNARTQQIQSYLDWYSALARLNFALGAGDTQIVKGKTQ